MAASSLESIADLYANHHGWLKGWLRKKLGCADTAADLAQDTYVRVISTGRLPQLEQSRAYLTQIAKHLVIDLHRRRRLELAWLDALALMPPAQMPSEEDRAIVLETLCLLDAALERLPAKVRETFLLSQFDGLTYAEIAARLDVSVGSVRKYMLKAAATCLDVMTEDAGLTAGDDERG